MTSVRPLFFLLITLCVATSAWAAAGDGANDQASNGSVQNQTVDPALFGQPAQLDASDLFFLKEKPRVKFATPPRQSRQAALTNADCYTMRMYKVKRKEHFADGESGTLGYATCELASNYQMRTAIAHPRSREDNGSRGAGLQK